MSGTATSPNTTYSGSTTSTTGNLPGSTGAASQLGYNYGMASIANTPFQAYGGETTAGINPLQNTAAYNEIQLGNGAYQPQQVTAGNVTGYTQGTGNGNLSTNGMNLTGYMSPYTSGVIDTSMDELNRQLQKTDVASDGQAAMSGAFGGDRAAIVNTENARNTNQIAAQTISGLNQSNYQNAETQAQTDLSRQLQAGTTQAQLGLQAGQGNQFAGLQGANLQSSANNSAFQMGTSFQNTNQTADNNAYSQYLRAFNYPMQNALAQGQLTSEYAPTLQYQGTTTQAGQGISTPPSPSTASQVIGGLTAAGGLAGALFGGNNSGGLVGAAGSALSSAGNYLFGSTPTSTLDAAGTAANAANGWVDTTASTPGLLSNIGTGISNAASSAGNWISNLFEDGGVVGPGGLAQYAKGGRVHADDSTYLSADDDSDLPVPPAYVPPPDANASTPDASASTPDASAPTLNDQGGLAGVVNLPAGNGVPAAQGNVGDVGLIGALANAPAPGQTAPAIPAPVTSEPLPPPPQGGLAGAIAADPNAATAADPGPAVPINPDDAPLPVPPAYVPPPDDQGGVAGAASQRLQQSAKPDAQLPPQGLPSVQQPRPGSPGAPALGAGQPGQPAGDWLDRLHNGSNSWALPVMAAGLGMMASKSPFLGTAIGEGGLAALGEANQMYSGRQQAALKIAQMQQTAAYQQGMLANKAGQLDINRDRAGSYATLADARAAQATAAASAATYRQQNPKASVADIQMGVMADLQNQGLSPSQAYEAMHNYTASNAFKQANLDERTAHNTATEGQGDQRLAQSAAKESDIQQNRDRVAHQTATAQENMAAANLLNNGKAKSYADAIAQVRAGRTAAGPAPVQSTVANATPAAPTATDPQTGAKMVYRGGTWQPL